MSTPFDTKSDFFRKYFQQAETYEVFLNNSEPAHKSRWQGYESKFSLTAEQKELLSGFKRELNVLVLAGAWCGDCARQCPMLKLIADNAPSMNLKFVDNERFPELRDELRIHGASRVPVTVTLSEDFFEINRFGDRTLTAYRRKARTELGAACETGIIAPPADELAGELSEWITHFERLHLMLRVSPYLRTRHKD